MENKYKIVIKGTDNGTDVKVTGYGDARLVMIDLVKTLMTFGEQYGISIDDLIEKLEKEEEEENV